MLIKINRKEVVAIPQEQYQVKHLEKHLEEIVENAPEAFLGMDVLLIGRQVRTERGIIDLLGLDKDGNTVIIELKRNESTREIISQAISYRSHFRRKINIEKLNKIAEGYIGQTSDDNLIIKQKFKEKFGTLPGELNKKQIIVLIAEQFPEEVLADLEEIADHVCIEFTYYVSPTGEEYMAARRTSEPDLSGTKDTGPETKSNEFDTFFAEVIKRVKTLVPSSLSTFKNTYAGSPQTQWVRFHWHHTDVHVGLFAKQRKSGALVSVYFTNWSLDPAIAKILNGQRKALSVSLGITGTEDDYAPNKRTSIEKTIGQLTDSSRTKVIEEAAQAVASFLGELKPLLGEKL